MSPARVPRSDVCSVAYSSLGLVVPSAHCIASFREFLVGPEASQQLCMSPGLGMPVSYLCWFFSPAAALQVAGGEASKALPDNHLGRRQNSCIPRHYT